MKSGEGGQTLWASADQGQVGGFWVLARIKPLEELVEGMVSSVYISQRSL